MTCFQIQLQGVACVCMMFLANCLLTGVDWTDQCYHRVVVTISVILSKYRSLCVMFHCSGSLKPFIDCYTRTEEFSHPEKCYLSFT